MTTLIRPLGLLVAVVAAGVLLAGCGSGPSQPGSAAIVGNTAISLDQVQRELDTVLASQPQARQDQQQGTFDQDSRDIVRARVIHQLVITAQQREHIAIGDQQVDQLISQSGGADAVASQLVYDVGGIHQLASDELAELALAQKYADRLAITFDYVAAADHQDAINKANQIANNPGSMGELVNAAAVAGGVGQLGAHLTLAQYLQQPQAAVAPLFGALPNTVLVFQPDPQNSPAWLVVLLRSRTVAAASTSSTSSAASASPQDLVAIGICLLQPIAQEQGVRINPRYGIWDPVGMRVVATGDPTAGVTLPVRVAAS